MMYHFGEGFGASGGYAGMDLKAFRHSQRGRISRRPMPGAPAAQGSRPGTSTSPSRCSGLAADRAGPVYKRRPRRQCLVGKPPPNTETVPRRMGRSRLVDRRTAGVIFAGARALQARLCRYSINERCGPGGPPSRQDLSVGRGHHRGVRPRPGSPRCPITALAGGRGNAECPMAPDFARLPAAAGVAQTSHDTKPLNDAAQRLVECLDDPLESCRRRAARTQRSNDATADDLPVGAKRTRLGDDALPARWAALP